MGQQQMDMNGATPQSIKGGHGKQKLLYNCILMQHSSSSINDFIKIVLGNRMPKGAETIITIFIIAEQIQL